ncbi:hypothetical protein Q3G72_001875 [Acer saccharum]|nr:hypothetical protein Q3G72_001875 [Acer saccharum]
MHGASRCTQDLVQPEAEAPDALAQADSRHLGCPYSEPRARLKRAIFIWKPRKSPQPKPGGPLRSSGYLKDNWISIVQLKHLKDRPPVSSRKFFYRVENTVTPQADNPIVSVQPVTSRIHGYARLFIIQCHS